MFPQETMAAGENRFAPELNEKEVIELLEALPSIVSSSFFRFCSDFLAFFARISNFKILGG